MVQSVKKNKKTNNKSKVCFGEGNIRWKSTVPPIKSSLFSARFAGIHLAICCCFPFFQVYNSLEKVAGKGASFHCYKKKLLVDIIIKWNKIQRDDSGWSLFLQFQLMVANGLFWRIIQFQLTHVFPFSSQASHEKTPLTFHYTGCLIGILRMVY